VIDETHIGARAKDNAIAAVAGKGYLIREVERDLDVPHLQICLIEYGIRDQRGDRVVGAFVSAALGGIEDGGLEEKLAVAEGDLDDHAELKAGAGIVKG